MEKLTVVIAFRQLVSSCIDQLEKDGVKPEVVYKNFLQRKGNILMQINGVTNRKEHLTLMQIANKVYVNPTTRANKDLLVKEFKKTLAKLPTAVNGFKDTNK